MTNHAPPCPTCGYPQEGDACFLCSGEIRLADGPGTAHAGRGFFVADLAEGFFSLFNASLQLMTKKEYMGKLSIAVAVNLILVFTFAAGILWGTWSLIHAISWPWGWLETAAEIAAWPMAVIATWFLAPALINAGMTPFLDGIANATERMHAGEKMKPVEIGIWGGIMAGANSAAQVLVLQLCVLIPVLLLALIPIIGWFFMAFGVLFSAYLNALVWLEIPVLRRGYGWHYRRQLLRRNWARGLGLGLAFNLGILVPVFNFLFLGPATAVAVSSLYFRFDKAVGPFKGLKRAPPPAPQKA